MSHIPNFSSVAFGAVSNPIDAAASANLDDAREHRRQVALWPARPRRARFQERLAGAPALPARAVSDHVRQSALDGATVRRVLDRRGVERVLSRQSRRRPERPVGRFRSGDASRLQLGSSAGSRRRRHGGRRHRFDLRHAHPVCRHPAQFDQRFDDHEWRGSAGDGVVHCRRRRTGRADGGAVGDHSERHPEGVHGPQHLYLSARRLDAHRRRHFRLHRGEHAEIQFNLDLRLSHAGGGRDAGSRARLHARRRRRILARRRRRRDERRCVRAAPVVLLGDRA